MNKALSEPLRTVLIVGGGTAGWMTAAYLCKAFGATTQITLVESPQIKKIGVGEATVPNLQKVFFDFLEIPEREWMMWVNGSFKTAVKFINWRKRAAGAPPHHFYHPFGVLPNVGDTPLPQYWFHETLGQGEPVDYACFASPPLMDAQRAPRLMDGTTVIPTAWHFDAHLVVDFLTEWSKQRGVVQILDEVKHVALDETGAIGGVHTASGAVLSADLYIDCTGFRGLLINQALEEPFIDMQDHLLCDSAVAAAIPHDDERLGIEPYTSAIAMKAGWTWKIPMLGRFGSGYVYSSQFATEEEAIRDYCELWGIDPAKINLNRIRFRTGRNRRAWVKNCVSIGLSSCFLEPLESTGIYFVTTAIYQLAKYFPSRAFEPDLMDCFNRAIEYMYDDNRDFIQAHYFTTTRDDSPFWLANRHDLTLSDSIQEKFTLYKAGRPVNPPLPLDIYYSSFENEFRNFWTDGNYYCIFSGMGVLPERPYAPLADQLDAIEAAKRIFADIKQKQQTWLAQLPTNYEYLRHLHAQEQSADRSPALATSWGATVSAAENR
ncbi:MAG: tryptophan 7-halogenase [Caldilineaceae bacterium]|nr:tryptophan 7-halogenase [Caldilineaceae bacterium]